LRSRLAFAGSRASKTVMTIALATLLLPATAHASVRHKLRTAANNVCRRDNQAADGVWAPCSWISPVSCINGGFGIKYCRVTAQRNRDSGTFVVTRRFRANAR
jgi:hypothetical protein